MRAQSRLNGRDRRPARLVLPVLLIIVGFVFLLNNLGIVPWSIWLSLAQLWPVILILLGVDILLGRRSTALGALITTVVLIAVVGAAIGMSVSNPGTTSSTKAPLQEQTSSAPLGGASSGDVSLTIPAGTLNVGALPAKGDNLLEVASTMPSGMRMTLNAAPRGGIAEAVLSASGDRTTWWPFGRSGFANTATWNVQLVPGVPLSLRANVGAGQTNLDLTNLMIQHLIINSGAVKTTIHFPAGAGQTDADIRSGAGELDLIIPP